MPASRWSAAARRSSSCARSSTSSDFARSRSSDGCRPADCALLRRERHLHSKPQHRQHADVGDRGIRQRASGRVDGGGRRAGNPDASASWPARAARRLRSAGGERAPSAGPNRSGRARSRTPLMRHVRRARGRRCASGGSPRIAARGRRANNRPAARLPSSAPMARPSRARHRHLSNAALSRAARLQSGGPEVAGRLSRLARMDRAELTWRAAAAARIAADRLHVRVVAPAWDRGALVGLLAPSAALSEIREAVASARWPDAQRALAAHFTTAPQRFVISPAAKRDLADRIRAEFPQSVAQATARADRIRARQVQPARLSRPPLRAGRAPWRPRRGPPGASPPASPQSAAAATVDWQFDPGLNRRPPFAFWAICHL